jgi:hypothetical protein
VQMMNEGSESPGSGAGRWKKHYLKKFGIHTL